MSGNGQQGKFPYPGVPTTADGSAAVVWVDSHVTTGACAYPITSSTAMGVGYQMEVANGKKNVWDQPLSFIELESEHSSASTCEGYALAGGRVSNFTSGQGLILMKEVLYAISGKRLPAVFQIGARAMTSHSLNVHAGHDDVMGVADCGWGILFARNAQEAGDMALIARRAAEDSKTPFLNVQDGFLTTHTVEKVLLPEPEMMKKFIGAPEKKLVNLMNPLVPIMSGVVQNQDSYMKGKIAQRFYYDNVLGAVQTAMDEFYQLTGRRYQPADAYRLDDADYAIVGMGGMLETAQATVDWLRREEDLKVGTLHITCFRPFPGPQIVEALKNAKAIAIVERMDDPQAQSNPLAAEIKAAFADALTGRPGYPKIDRMPVIYAGAAGLGSRDVRAGDFVATAHMMANGDDAHRYFVLGIKHELSLPVDNDPDVRPEGAFSMRGHSVGGYGSVTTNKVIATIAGDLFGMDVQAYPKYGSEKKGLPTTYYLTIGKGHIRTHCELTDVDFIPLNDINAFYTGNPLVGLADRGTLFVQIPYEDPAEVWSRIPDYAKKILRKKNARVLSLNAAKIAREVATDPSLEVRMQGIVLLGIFLKTTPFVEESGVSEEQLMASVEKSLRKYFGRRGEQTVQDNLTCVRRGFAEVFEISAEVMAA